MRNIKVKDLGYGCFKDENNNTYIWDLKDGILGYIENEQTGEQFKVVNDIRDENDNVTEFIIE